MKGKKRQPGRMCYKSNKQEDANSQSSFVKADNAQHEDVLCSETTWKMLSSDKVWDFLGRCLNFTDLKTCRLVCKNFNQMVLRRTNLARRAMISLHDDQITRENFGSTTVMWPNIKLNINLDSLVDSRRVEMDLECLSWLFPLLERVEHLILTLQFGRQGKETNLQRLFLNLVEAPRRLKILEIDPIFINNCRSIGSTRKIEALNYLEELVIIESPCAPFLVTQRSFELFAMQLSNLRVLRTAFPLSPTTSFTLEKMRGMNQFLRSFESALMQLCSSICRINRAHIETLQHISCLKHVVELLKEPVLTFPNLKTLEVNLKEVEMEGVVKFLSVQPLLKDLLINVKDGKMARNFLVEIGGMSAVLETLYISAHGFGSELDQVWPFLSRTKLEEFYLVDLSDPDRGTVENWFPRKALRSLPETLRSLKIMGVRKWKIKGCLGPKDFASIDVNKLTVLNLSFCGEAVNDDTLEHIFRDFVMLREFVLKCAPRVTDYGFTGLSRRQKTPKFSMASLKGLTSLTLNLCGTLSDQTLIHGVRFLELHYLNVAVNKNITGLGISAILDQNPSLETLMADYGPIEKCNKGLARGDIMGYRPRLWRVVALGRWRGDVWTETEEVFIECPVM